ncbi:MAG: HI0074 family nucleotidyltransferase substrate-binding subunit [Vicinamibacterales bacterium]
MPNDSSAPTTRRARLLLGDGQRAVARLADALAQPETEFVRDAAIQRFEFSFELTWKAIQAVARLEGQDCTSPRTALSTAWRNGWLDDETAWIEMLEDRNKTSHTYRDAVAKDVFGRLAHHLPRLRQLLTALSSRISEIEGSDG